MRLILNGGLYVNGEEIYFEDLEVEIEEKLPFDDIDDYYEENDVEDYLYDDEYIDENGDNPLNKLIDKYAEILTDSCTCKDCLTEILGGFVDELIEL